MTGQEVIAWCAALSAAQVLALEARARAGQPEAAALFVAYGAYQKCVREKRPLDSLAVLFDNVSMKVEYA